MAIFWGLTLLQMQVENRRSLCQVHHDKLKRTLVLAMKVVQASCSRADQVVFSTPLLPLPGNPLVVLVAFLLSFVVRVLHEVGTQKALTRGNIDGKIVEQSGTECFSTSEKTKPRMRSSHALDKHSSRFECFLSVFLRSFLPSWTLNSLTP